MEYLLESEWARKVYLFYRRLSFAAVEHYWYSAFLANPNVDTVPIIRKVIEILYSFVNPFFIGCAIFIFLILSLFALKDAMFYVMEPWGKVNQAPGYREYSVDYQREEHHR